MPKFVTISPTHVPGQKRKTWDRFRLGNYIAIGWLVDQDLQGWSDRNIREELESRQEPSWVDGQHDLPRFVNHLSVGDLVAVTNSNASILGLGKITSDYFYAGEPHETGNQSDRYPHFRSVRWLSTEEWRRSEIIGAGEVSWEPRGTLGRITDVPAYIWRALNDEAVKNIDIAETATSDAGEYTSKGGQGFQSIPERKKAVEDYSMRLAEEHYKSLGFITEVKGKPYDLLCRRGNEILFVEVKGTESHGDFILLTRNEVALSRTDLMELFVISEICSSRDATGAWTCSGGSKRILQPWVAEKDRLEPYAFIYRLG